MSDVRAGLDAVKSELIEESIDGTSYWKAAHSEIVESPDSPSVYIPPGFDEYLLGYKIRDAILDPQHARKVCPGLNGIFFPTIVVDGQMVAIWKRTFKGKSVVFDVTPFATLSPVEKEAFITATQRFGAFLEMPIKQPVL
jgi:hypothetical protein